MLQLESIRFGTATLATQLESIQFGTAILAPQLETIRFAFPLFAHNIKASDLVPLLLHHACPCTAHRPHQARRGCGGIATGEALRRLTSRVLARRFAGVFDEDLRSERAPAHAVAALLRYATDADEQATVVCLRLHGRAAYNSVSRAAVLSKVRDVAPGLLPFVRAIYGH